MLNGLSLFSGIGGLDIALEQWVKPVIYCEINPYCQAVLLSRMADESICNAPVWDDITTFDGLPFNGAIDIIYGGFPCQDISCAGLGKGLEGERSGLFFEIMRLAKEIKPKYVFLENVGAITHRGGLECVKELASLGYDCRWCVISAASVGAMHRRERWFLLAYSKRERLEGGEDSGQPTFSEPEHSGASLADTASESTDGHTLRETETHALPRNSSETLCDTDSQPSEQANKITQPEPGEWDTRRGLTGFCRPYGTPSNWQEAVSSMGKLSDGIPYHVDRLRALGNSVVPIQAQEAFKILMGL
jgi:DNA (cytosine-5)-methyltransferase 1